MQIFKRYIFANNKYEVYAEDEIYRIREVYEVLVEKTTVIRD